MERLALPTRRSSTTCTSSCSHWCLVVAHAWERRLQYYDSMGGPGRRYLGGLQLFLQDEAKKFKGVAGVDQSWT